eukprot:273415-Chlamydomonas_euryale.AAC.2
MASARLCGTSSKRRLSQWQLGVVSIKRRLCRGWLSSASIKRQLCQGVFEQCQQQTAAVNRGGAQAFLDRWAWRPRLTPQP